MYAYQIVQSTKATFKNKTSLPDVAGAKYLLENLQASKVPLILVKGTDIQTNKLFFIISRVVGSGFDKLLSSFSQQNCLLFSAQFYPLSRSVACSLHEKSNCQLSPNAVMLHFHSQANSMRGAKQQQQTTTQPILFCKKKENFQFALSGHLLPQLLSHKSRLCVSLAHKASSFCFWSLEG